LLTCISSPEPPASPAFAELGRILRLWKYHSRKEPLTSIVAPDVNEDITIHILGVQGQAIETDAVSAIRPEWMVDWL